MITILSTTLIFECLCSYKNVAFIKRLALFPFDVEVSLIAHQIRYGVMVEPSKVVPAMEIAQFSVSCNIKGEQSQKISV